MLGAEMGKQSQLEGWRGHGGRTQGEDPWKAVVRDVGGGLVEGRCHVGGGFLQSGCRDCEVGWDQWTEQEVSKRAMERRLKGDRGVRELSNPAWGGRLISIHVDKRLGSHTQ